MAYQIIRDDFEFMLDRKTRNVRTQSKTSLDYPNASFKSITVSHPFIHPILVFFFP